MTSETGAPADREGSGAAAALLFWSVALPVVLALRLPYLLSPPYILDNDEAVVGLMARHIAAGLELPLRFYGQNYGLSVFETVPAAAAFTLFGDAPYVLPLTMVALFATGLVPWAAALGRLSGSPAWGRVLAVVLVLLPGWVVWSTKARGIHVSSFVLTGCVLALLTRPQPGRVRVLVAGALAGLVFQIQPLWLVVIVPFVALPDVDRRDVAHAVALALIIGLGPYLLPGQADAFWQPNVVEGVSLDRLRVVPDRLLRAFAGDVTPHRPGRVAKLLGWAGSVSFFFVMIGLAVAAARRRCRPCLLAGMAMVGSVVYVVLLRVQAPRYLLPSTVALLLGVATWLGARRTRARGIPLVSTGVLLVALAVGATRLGYEQSRSTALASYALTDLYRLLASLEEDGVRGVYATSNVIQWQLLFYGDERIPARGRSLRDRYPAYPEAVAEARRQGLPTALVAELLDLQARLPRVDSFPGYRIGGNYLRLDDPPDPLLRLLGFELADSTDSDAGAAIDPAFSSSSRLP